MNLLIVIPARGGSKGIPRKNLRPLAGKPLIYYSITEALKVNIVGVNVDVFVTTDDEEIGLFAQRFGARVIHRDKNLANDLSTLDPVIKHAFGECQKLTGRKYQYICTVQPTSPLVSYLDVENSFKLIESEALDTVMSVVDDRHLFWTTVNGKGIPLYNERVNRQQLPPNFKETGAVVICSSEQLNTNDTRVGERVSIYNMPVERSFDIDTYADLSICEAMLSRKKIVFTVVGYAEVGLGHAYRTLMLAHELVQFDLVFVIEKQSDLAIRYIQEHNYTVVIAEEGMLAERVNELNADLIINDILDTTSQYMDCIKSNFCKVVNFEDLGEGASQADFVVNALYPHQSGGSNVLVGAKYFCLRDEFLYLGEQLKRTITSVLITFGGVDEGDVTRATVKELSSYAVDKQLFLDIVVGPGYQNYRNLVKELSKYDALDYSITKQTNRISEHMIKADLAITSGGRTVLELNALKIPTIVICQNDRELSHSFASFENGVLNLGHRNNISKGDIVKTVDRVINDGDLKKEMIQSMEKLDLSRGKERVISKIKSLLV